MRQAIKSTRLYKWKMSPMDILKRASNEAILSKIAKPKRERFRWYIEGQRCKDYMTQSRWGLLISNPLTNDPQSKQGKLFRRRFRVPFPVFLEMIQDCKDKKIFGRGKNSFIPVEIKLLCVLRMLGRDEIADTISELSDVGESTCNTLFKTFIKEYVNHFKDKYLPIPSADDIRENMIKLKSQFLKKLRNITKN